MALGDRPTLVFGTMGGEAQVPIHLQLLARMLVAGEAVEHAIAAPRWILSAGALFVEDGLPQLQPPGRAIQRMPVPDLAGHAHAIRLAAGLEAGCDPRADGVPVGDSARVTR